MLDAGIKKKKRKWLQKIKTLERQGDGIRKMEKASQKQEKVLDFV